MDSMLDSIHIAMGDGASADDRRRGAAACRALADTLDGANGSAEPIAAVDTAGTIDLCADGPDAPIALVAEPPPVPAPTPLSLALGPNPFAGMTADQILDLAIAKLRGAVGDGAQPVPAGQPFRLSLVPVPRLS